MTTLIENLVDAARIYGSCAKVVSKRLSNPISQALESERVIGFGIASDWNRRAATLTGISYRRRIKGSLVHRSMTRNAGVTELVRFNMVWSAINAIFSRTAILHLLDVSLTRCSGSLQLSCTPIL